MLTAEIYSMHLKAWKLQTIFNRKRRRTCKDCNNGDWQRLTFYHRNEEEKRFLISHSLRLKVSLFQVIIEINKCDLICQRCRAYRQDKKLRETGTRPKLPNYKPDFHKTPAVCKELDEWIYGPK